MSHYWDGRPGDFDEGPVSVAEQTFSRRLLLEALGWRFIQNVSDCTGGNKPAECVRERRNCATDECPSTTWIAVVPLIVGKPLPTIEGVPVTKLTVKTEEKAVNWAWGVSVEWAEVGRIL